VTGDCPATHTDRDDCALRLRLQLPSLPPLRVVTGLSPKWTVAQKGRISTAASRFSISFKKLSADDSIAERRESAMTGDNVPGIRNKIKRQAVYRSAKVEKAKAKFSKRKERAEAETLDPKLKEAAPPPPFPYHSYI
jgi:hypothetical protein